MPILTNPSNILLPAFLAQFNAADEACFAQSPTLSTAFFIKFPTSFALSAIQLAASTTQFQGAYQLQPPYLKHSLPESSEGPAINVNKSVIPINVPSSICTSEGLFWYTFPNNFLPPTKQVSLSSETTPLQVWQLFEYKNVPGPHFGKHSDFEGSGILSDPQSVHFPLK